MVEEKAELMRKLGRKQLTVYLAMPIAQVPERLSRYGLLLDGNGRELTYTYDTQAEHTRITGLLADLRLRDRRRLRRRRGHIGVSLGMTMVFLVVCLGAVWWIFKTAAAVATAARQSCPPFIG